MIRPIGHHLMMCDVGRRTSKIQNFEPFLQNLSTHWILFMLHKISMSLAK